MAPLSLSETRRASELQDITLNVSTFGAGSGQAGRAEKRRRTETLPPKPAEEHLRCKIPVIALNCPSTAQQRESTESPVHSQAGHVGCSGHAESTQALPTKGPAEEDALGNPSCSGIPADWSAFLFGAASKLDYGTDEQVHEAALKLKSLSEAEP